MMFPRPGLIRSFIVGVGLALVAFGWFAVTP